MIYQADEVRSRFAERRLAFVPGATLQGRIAEIFGAGQTIELAVERVVREVAAEPEQCRLQPQIEFCIGRTSHLASSPCLLFNSVRGPIYRDQH